MTKKRIDQMLQTVADLKPAPYNPREISDTSFEGLKESVAAFGDIAGIVWNRTTGHLVAGHQRVRALRSKYGDDNLRIHTEGPNRWIVCPDGSKFSIRVVEWDEPTEKAANVAANSPLIAGVFTDDLREVLADVKAALPDVFEAVRLPDLEKAFNRIHGEPTGDAPDQSDEVGEKFSIVVFCQDERHQVELLERLTKEGLECRALVS